MSDLVALIGRIFLSVIFIGEGYGKLLNLQRTAEYIGTKMPAIPQLEEALGMTSPMIYAYAACAVELLCGILIVVGFLARFAAVILAIYCALAIYFFHNFWAVAADQMLIQRIHALKDLAIIGGLLMLSLYGPGGFALGGRRRQPQAEPTTREEPVLD